MWLIVAALAGAIGVSAGAFGAHGLKDVRLREALHSEQPQVRAAAQRRLDAFETGVRNQMFHVAGLLAVGLLSWRGGSVWLEAAGWLFVAGIVLFSGLLYLWAFGGPGGLVHIVPVGGTAYILGWLALAVAAWRSLGPGN